MDSIQTVLSPEQKAAFRPIPITLKKGEASFHHPLLVHGSYANRSPRPRRAAVINVFADGVKSDADEPLLEGTRPIPRGERMGGQFHPLLFEGTDG
jgi:ectoine hydroxylase-related dioxygenase (phytanoyl-CoA dioxygenase family)